jgi:hypothetical protein
VSDPVFSPDGAHVAFWRRERDGHYVVFRDGKAGPAFLAVGRILFSPDGRSLVYAAASGPDFELNTLVVDDRSIAFLEPSARHPGEKPPGPRSIRYVWGYHFLQDGRLIYFASLMGGKDCFIVADQASPEFDSAGQPAFDPASRHVAFVAREDKASEAVVDGVPGPPFETVNYLQFDPTGRRLAYTAQKDSATFVVADGQPGERFDDVGWVRFSDDGTTLAYWAKAKGQWFVVVNGVRKPVDVAASLVGNLILGGPGDRTPVFSMREGDRWFLVLGTRKAGPYDEIGPFFFDAASESVVVGTRTGREFFRQVLPLEPKSR